MTTKTLNVGELPKLYNLNKVLFFEGNLYEKLDDFEYEWRIIFTEDDYDYVEDKELISKLNQGYIPFTLTI